VPDEADRRRYAIQLTRRARALLQQAMAIALKLDDAYCFAGKGRAGYAAQATGQVVIAPTARVSASVQTPLDFPGIFPEQTERRSGIAGKRRTVLSIALRTSLNLTSARKPAFAFLHASAS